MGHLIQGEKTDWITRMNIILSANPDKHFKPFDRFATIQRQQRKIVEELIDEFKKLRAENVKTFKRKIIGSR
jgi:hypothetical protein